MLGANNQLVAHDRRGCHAQFIVLQGVCVQQFELATGLDDERLAVLVQAEDLVVVGPWRSGEGSPEGR